MKTVERFCNWLNNKLNKLVKPVKIEKGDNVLLEPFFRLYTAQERLYVSWNPIKDRTFSLGWKWLVGHFRLEMNFSDLDDKLYIGFGCFLFDVSISFEFLNRTLLKWVLRGGTSREFGVYISSDCVRFNFWHDDFGHAKKVGWSYFKSTEVLLRGYPIISEYKLESWVVIGKVPEFAGYEEEPYRLTVTEYRVSHYFDRWYFLGRYVKNFYRYSIDVHTEHRHSGKGENPWDCDDNIHDNLSVSLGYDEERLTPQAAASRWEADLIECRSRYG